MKAIVRGIPSSIVHALCIEKPSNPINVQISRQQHSQYVNILKTHLGSSNVIELDADEKYPDCVFVEDTVVVIGKTVLINHMGAESRRGEVIQMKKAIEMYKDYSIVQMNSPACMDGGDVLYVPSTKDIFVGLSRRTNKEGVVMLQKTFPKCNVITINVKKGLHLKSFVTYFAAPIEESAPQDLIFSGCDIGKDIYQQFIEKKKNGKYRAWFTPDIATCNCLSVKNDHNKWIVMYKSGYKQSEELVFKKLEKEYKGVVKLISIEYDELAKVDGALTCCSVLLE